jgi:NIPSNAP
MTPSPDSSIIDGDGEKHSRLVKMKNKEARTFELRIYTLPGKDDLDFYKDEVYPRHLKSFPLFGIEAHGFWTLPSGAGHQLYALVSYPTDQEPSEVVSNYMNSKEFTDDISGFDPKTIVSVETMILRPTDSSPLR